MTYDRLFTFGCSFTNFAWPTWADIIAYDLGIPFENYGRAGHGNVSIAIHLAEADLIHNFTDRDLILVCWSSWSREDRLMPGGWLSGGTVFNNHVFGPKWIKRYWAESNDNIKNLHAIISSNKMFNINFQSHIQDYLHGRSFDQHDFSPWLKYLNEHVPKMLFANGFTVNDGPAKRDWNGPPPFEGLLIDGHPDIIRHLMHAEFVYDTLGISMKEQTIKDYNNLQNKICKDLKLKFPKKPLQGWDNIYKYMSRVDWGPFIGDDNYNWGRHRK